MTDIVAPTLGESVTEATVAQWLKKAGDTVSKDEPIVELETDKVTLEVAAPEDGVLDEVLAAEGTTVGIGDVLGRVSARATATAGASAPARETSSANGANGHAPAPQPKPAPSSAPEPAPAASGSGDLVDVALPQMGESVTEGTIAAVLVSVGDSIEKDSPVVEVETDKAAVEIPAPAGGIVEEITVKEGEDVEVGTVVARIRSGAAPAQTSSSASPVAKDTGSDAQAGDPPTQERPGHAAGQPMPAARRVMDEGGVDPANVEGTGKGGRITKMDAVKAIESRPEPTALARVPEEGRELAPREERVRMTRLRQTIARRLKEAQQVAAMLTTFNDCDMTNVMAARKKYKDAFLDRHGVKLGFMGFFVKAVVQALKDVPAVNAEIDGDSIIYKNYYDIGVAVGTDRGLVVPVVRGADEMSLGDIEREIGDLGARARDGALTLDDMQGATFTISNGGVYGSMMSTPILNAPQSGILGMHRIEERPVVRDGQIVARPMMYLALTYDHRIVDGKEAVSFLVRIKEMIEDPERMLLDI